MYNKESTLMQTELPMNMHTDGNVMEIMKSYDVDGYNKYADGQMEVSGSEYTAGNVILMRLIIEHCLEVK